MHVITLAAIGSNFPTSEEKDSNSYLLSLVTWTLFAHPSTHQLLYMKEEKRRMGLHINGTWALAKKTYWTTQKWHMSACQKDIWDYTNITREGLWKRHMGLHKNGTWMLVKKAYGTTQKWHMNACEKHIWDYTKMAHECLLKRHMGLHKNGTWMLVEKAYGTTQKWHVNACWKGIWDYTKMAHECLLKRHMGLHKIGTWTIAFYYSQEILETMSSILPWEFSASQQEEKCDH
jgi:hypothetical protein